MRLIIERQGTPKSPARSADITKLREFLTAAYRDYIAARVLLVADLPLQGAIQASTAIEKYFKVILTFRGNRSDGHLKKAHINAVRNFNPTLFQSFNEEFLGLLQRVYNYRYPDSLPRGSNLVIATREFLAELDHTALAIHGGIGLQEDGKDVETAVEEGMRKKDERLFAGNHVIGRIPKQEFISAYPQLVYESRLVEKGVMIEATYDAKPRTSDGHFLREGLRPSSDDGRSYLLAFHVLKPESPAPSNTAADAER